MERLGFQSAIKSGKTDWQHASQSEQNARGRRFHAQKTGYGKLQATWEREHVARSSRHVAGLSSKTRSHHGLCSSQSVSPRTPKRAREARALPGNIQHSSFVITSSFVIPV
jgi:hypothetical protein